MKHQALFSSKDKSKNLKCRLLQFLFGALRVKRKIVVQTTPFSSRVQKDFVYIGRERERERERERFLWVNPNV